jgi:hypothetical protein
LILFWLAANVLTVITLLVSNTLMQRHLLSHEWFDVGNRGWMAVFRAIFVDYPIHVAGAFINVAFLAGLLSKTGTAEATSAGALQLAFSKGRVIAAYTAMTRGLLYLDLMMQELIPDTSTFVAIAEGLIFVCLFYVWVFIAIEDRGLFSPMQRSVALARRSWRVLLVGFGIGICLGVGFLTSLMIATNPFRNYESGSITAAHSVGNGFFAFWAIVFLGCATIAQLAPAAIYHASTAKGRERDQLPRGVDAELVIRRAR